MKIDQNIIDDLNQTIAITVSPSDYKDKFKSELKKHADKAQMKGFRKGKTPSSIIKKMYGQQVLAEVVNEHLMQGIDGYLKENELSILGQPIPAEDQDQNIVFDPNNLQDFTFKFDIGLSPKFEIVGVNNADNYVYNDVIVDDELINEEIDHITAQMGKQEETEETIEAKDIITFDAEELDGDAAKEGGWATTFNVIVESLSDDYKEDILTKKVGDVVDFDIYNLEKDREESYVNKYLLNKTEADEEVSIGNQFRGKISKVARLKKAEFDQELFDQYFGKDEVSGEEEAREKIATKIKDYYNSQADQILYRNIMDNMLENTTMELPKGFLKRWVKLNNEQATDEQIDNEFEGFLGNLKWTLIKGELRKRYEVEVTQEDVKNAMTSKVYGYFNQYGLDPSMLSGVMDQMMSNQEEVNKTYEEIVADRVFKKIAEDVQKEHKEISKEDFVSLVKEMNEKQTAEK